MRVDGKKLRELRESYGITILDLACEMMYELTSKKTGKISVVDEETYLLLSESNELKKYKIEQLAEPVKVVPEEIIKRTSKNKIND